MGDMEYRLLESSEKPKLVEVFPHYAGLDLSVVPISGALDEQGEVKGLAVLNLVAHCEPIWIAPGVRVDFRRLVETVEKQVRGPELWVFAPNEKIARMAEICGAKEVDWKIYRKELAGCPLSQ